MQPVRRTVISFTLLLAAARGLELPFERRAESLIAGSGEKSCGSAKWCVHVDDFVYFPPQDGGKSLNQRFGPSSSSSSSSFFSLLQAEQEQAVENYYFAVGSPQALTDELRQKRVGGQGQVHLFYLPEGPTSVTRPSAGDRRASLSSLVQLQSGMAVHADPYPDYDPVSAVEVDEQTAKLEADAASSIDGEKYRENLEHVVNVGKLSSKYSTRSWQNKDATSEAQSLLATKFSMLGMKTCLHKFKFQGYNLANVVAFMPGEPGNKETVTLGAHYDSRPYEGVAAPGAEDNGSGVASLLSVAQALVKSGLKPKKNVFFVGFAAEEPGLVGSDVFADAIHKQGGLPQECEEVGPSLLQGQISSSKASGTSKASEQAAEVGAELSRTPKTLEKASEDGVQALQAAGEDGVQADLSSSILEVGGQEEPQQQPNNNSNNNRSSNSNGNSNGNSNNNQSPTSFLQQQRGRRATLKQRVTAMKRANEIVEEAATKKKNHKLKMSDFADDQVPLHSAIILDEVGWVSEKFKHKQTINFESKDTKGTRKLMDSLYAANSADNGASSLAVIHNSNPFGSDHMSWLERGMPAVLVINADDEAYPNYHSSTDSIDGNVDMEYGAKVSRLVLGGLARAAEFRAA